MHIENLKLENFRNYKKEEIFFINGINLFIGNNAQGKTNIIESIYFAAFGKSYRTIKDNELINFDNEFKSGVIPVDIPTVLKADTTSKNTSLSPKGWSAHINNTAKAQHIK